MITIIKDPAYKPDAPRCRFCDIRVDYDPSDVQKQHGCGAGGCGMYNVVTCPRCQRPIQISKVDVPPRPPLPPYRTGK